MRILIPLPAGLNIPSQLQVPITSDAHDFIAGVIWQRSGPLLQASSILQQEATRVAQESTCENPSLRIKMFIGNFNRQNSITPVQGSMPLHYHDLVVHLPRQDLLMSHVEDAYSYA